ncbi:hypothetical protein [Paenibacillus polysaccharolyticus]|uniref:hypothetical protein n=1 Tax=Paenibacillus polysaccharolyticus TaxID=582692 RepID=UPI00300BCA50
MDSPAYCNPVWTLIHTAMLEKKLKCHIFWLAFRSNQAVDELRSSMAFFHSTRRFTWKGA